MRPPPAEPGAAEAQARPVPRVRCVIWVEAPAGQPAQPATRLQGRLPAAKMAVPQWHPRCFSSPTATLRCAGAVRWPCREAGAIPCPKSRRPRLRCSAKTARAAPRAARSPPRRRAAACRRGGGRDARAAGPVRLDAGSAQPLGRPWAPAFAQPPAERPVTPVPDVKRPSKLVLANTASARHGFAVLPVSLLREDSTCRCRRLVGSRRLLCHPWIRASVTDGRARLIAALQIATDTITVNTAISRRVIVRLDQTLEGKSHVSSFGHQT